MNYDATSYAEKATHATNPAPDQGRVLKGMTITGDGRPAPGSSAFGAQALQRRNRLTGKTGTYVPEPDKET